ncbi:MAG: hypothetical protein LBG52_07505 [Candidatus Peribacteria bacterium]|nr:hypothetical protein [Candidatus Peribacteria bacterium]
MDIIDNSFVEVSDFWNTTDGWIQSDFITDEVWNGDWNTGRINVDTTLPTEAFSPRTDISVYQHIGYRNLRDIYIELREADKTLQENIDTKQDELTFDAAPTEDSTNPVTS